MKLRAIVMIFVVGVFLLQTTVFSAELQRGATLFEDNFDTVGTFAENWKTRDGSGKNGSLFVGGGLTDLRSEIPADFFVECDMTMKHDMKNKTGFAGFVIDGVLFQVQPQGKAFFLGKDYQNIPVHSYKEVKGYELGRSVHLAVARKSKDNIATYTFFINNEYIGEIRRKLPEKSKDKISFRRYRVDEATIDNFRLSTLKLSDDASHNLTINSSFEYTQDEFPLYVTRNMFKPNYQLAKKMDYDKYVNLVKVDSSEKHSGNYSLKLVLSELSDGHEIGFHSTGYVEGRPGVMSIWMKSDQDDMKVKFNYGHNPRNAKTHSVGKEWKRYEIVVPKLPKRSPWPAGKLWITPKDNPQGGTLWIDDVQCELLDKAPTTEELESGKKFATVYRPASQLDNAKLKVEAKIVRAPSFKIPLLPKNVKPSANIDLWKSDAVKLDDFHVASLAPKNRTEAYLACDKDNLYVAFRNFGDKLQASKPGKGKDDGIAFTHGVECFFMPSGVGEEFMQFAANAAGALVDMGLGSDRSWNCDWDCKTVENKQLGSVDYLLTISLSAFASTDLSNKWLMNLCRNDGVSHENITLPSLQFVQYKNVNSWPEALFPEEVIRSHIIGVSSADLVDVKGRKQLKLNLGNQTGKAVKGKIRILDDQDKTSVIGEKEFTANTGNTPISFDIAKDTKDLKKVLVVYQDDAGKTVFNQKREVKVQKTVTILNRLSFYMNEPEAVFRVKVNLPDAGKYNAVLKCAGKKIQMKAAPKFSIKVPLKGIGVGIYDAVLALKEGNQAVASCSTKLIKREYKDGASQINRFSRSVIVNGKPIFMLTPFYTTFDSKKPEYYASIVDMYARYGFRSIHFLSEAKTQKGLSNIKAFIDAADARGMTYLHWTGNHTIGTKTLEGWEKTIKSLGGKNTIAYILLDEPELSMTAEQTLNFMRPRRPFFPYHPVMMNNTVIGIPNNYANLETDILMLDDYLTNREGRTVFSIVKWVDLMMKIGAAEGKPVYYFMVGANQPLHYREPSYAEQIAESYGAIASGCTGISYFFGMAQQPGNWKAMKQLAKETAILNDVITEEAECINVKHSGDPKYLRCLTKVHDGALYLITCNIDSKAAGEITFVLPKEYTLEHNTQKIEVMFEDRTISAKDGKFSDSYAGHERHVYRVKLKSN